MLSAVSVSIQDYSIIELRYWHSPDYSQCSMQQHALSCVQMA